MKVFSARFVFVSLVFLLNLLSIMLLSSRQAFALQIIPPNGSSGSGGVYSCLPDGADPCETGPAFWCTPSIGSPTSPYCNTNDWSLTYAVSCTICYSGIPGSCDYNYNYSYNTCSAVDRCYGATGPASGYDAAGRVAAGVCSASDLD